MVAHGERAAVSTTSQGSLSFERFFEFEYPKLVRALLPVAKDEAIAEECAQEAMAVAFERWERIRVMDFPVGYIYTIGVNLRRRRARRDAWQVWRHEQPGVSADPADGIVARSDLLSAISQLPAGQRDALLLVEVLGLDAATAGTVLGVAAASVRSRVHRSRTTLQHILGGGWA